MAAIHNITCEQGATFNLSITYSDPTGNTVDLTGYQARMDVRVTPSAPAPIVRLTTENDRIRLDGANGNISLVLSAAETANIPAAKFVYDLELVSASNTVTRLIQGSFTVDAEVTR